MDQFIQQLLQDKGLPADLDEAVRKQLVDDLTDRATDLVNRRLVEAMSEEDVKAFGELLDQQPEDGAAVQAFIEAHVPEKQDIAARALLEFRSLYLGSSL